MGKVFHWKYHVMLIHTRQILQVKLGPRTKVGPEETAAKDRSRRARGSGVRERGWLRRPRIHWGYLSWRWTQELARLPVPEQRRGVFQRVDCDHRASFPISHEAKIPFVAKRRNLQRFRLCWGLVQELGDCCLCFLPCHPPSASIDTKPPASFGLI